jgi:hypothetical protein
VGAWAPWDYIVAYLGVSAFALLFMHLTQRKAMDKLTQVYDQGLADQKQMIAALQSLVLILEQIVKNEREKLK